jgi:glycosyltransferase 2 family protein
VSNFWRWGLRLAISLAALALALKISAALSDQTSLQLPDIGWLVVAFLSHLAIVTLLSLRLGLMLSTLGSGARLSARELIAANWASLAVGQIALGSLSGDAVRIYATRRAGAPWPEAVSVIVIDRLIGLLGLVLLWAFALVFVLSPRAGALLATALCVAMVLGLLLLRHLSLRPLTGRIGAQLSLFADRLWLLARRPAGWLSLALALIAHALSVAVFYATACAFGLVPPLPASLVAVPAGLLSSVLPVSFGGWGVRELSIQASYQAMDVQFGTAVLASVLFGVINIAFNLPGLLALWQGFGAVRHSTNENGS